MENKKQLAQNYIWNTIGSVMSALSSFFLLLVVTRFMGAYYGGVFSLAYALAQQFQTLGAFEMRPYQATDISGRFSFKTYLVSRIITCLLMILGVVLYSLVTNGFRNEAYLIILVGFLRLFDAFEDVFHGAFQQKGRLDIAGKTLCFRVLTTMVSFSFSIIVFQDLAVSCILTLATSTISLALLNIIPAIKLLSWNGACALSEIVKLLAVCFPLFLAAFLSMYLTNAPRFGIEGFLPKEYQTYYSILFMPALVINLLSQFIFKPLLTDLAGSFNDANRKIFCHIILKGLLAVALSFLLLLLFTYPLGLPILGWLYSVDLSEFKNELVILLIGGFFNSAGIILYYALVAMRRQKYVLLGYGVSGLVTLFLSSTLISQFGMFGATLLYLVSMALLFVIFLLFCGAFLKKE